MKSHDDPHPETLPTKFKEFVAHFPKLGEAHAAIGKAVESHGPMDRKTIELVKIGISIGAGLETATKSHVRQAMQHGATQQEIEQTILLAYNTIGWPRMVMAMTWAQEQISRGV